MRTAAQTAAMMAVLTLGTKFLGFLREVFLAGFFGTSPVTDAYVMAGAIPGILFAGVFTSMSVSYMPLFSDIMEREGRAIWTIACDKQVTMRTAAYVHALRRLAEAIEAHGTQNFFVS